MTILKINPEYAALWGALPKPEYEALKESIRNDGLFEKIVVNPDIVILDGHNRYGVLQDLGVEVTREHYEIRDYGTREEELLYIIRSQINRRHATPYHRVENSLPLIEIERAKARQRQRLGGHEKVPQIFGEATETNEIIGFLIGISHETVRKALYIVGHGDEKMKDRLRRDNKYRINNAWINLQQRNRRPPPPMPEGIYDVIYADPPWKYSFSASTRGKAEMHYTTMPLDEIANLKVEGVPIQEKIAGDAVLFLWATNPMLEEALHVLKSWGFTYKTNMAWVKDIFGTGFYFRGQHELLLLGVKGTIGPPPDSARKSSVLHSKRREHSQKPDEIYDLIELMYPEYTYLELFSRNQREGWVMWGLEV